MSLDLWRITSSHVSLIPQPPKKDFIKMLENDGKILCFAAIMDSSQPEDKNRTFIICYRFSDDMMARNAGILGGKFLERTRVAKPGSSPDRPEFYRPQDFAIGVRVEVSKHTFIITDDKLVLGDKYVLKCMEAHADEFPTGTLNSLRRKHKLIPEQVMEGDKN